MTEQRDVIGPSQVPKPELGHLRCAAEAHGEKCPWRGVMLWHSVPFCANHAPPRRPGQSGWTRI